MEGGVKYWPMRIGDTYGIALFLHLIISENLFYCPLWKKKRQSRNQNLKHCLKFFIVGFTKSNLPTAYKFFLSISHQGITKVKANWILQLLGLVYLLNCQSRYVWSSLFKPENIYKNWIKEAKTSSHISTHFLPSSLQVTVSLSWCEVRRTKWLLEPSHFGPIRLHSYFHSHVLLYFLLKLFPFFLFLST